MPDRYIKRKGIIFDQIAEKGDQDQVQELKSKNMELADKFDSLNYEYKKIRRALEFMMPLLTEKMNDKAFKRQLIEKTVQNRLKDNGHDSYFQMMK